MCYKNQFSFFIIGGENISSELERLKIEKEKVRDRLNEIRPRRSKVYI